MTFSPIEKLILYAVLLAGLIFGVYWLDQSRQKIGYNRAVAEYNVKLIAAQADARAQEVAWQAKQKDIQEKTNDEINKRDAAYTVLARDNDILRNAATNYGNGLPNDTIAACRVRAATLAGLFGECTGALTEMARHAEGQRIDSISCLSSWPK